MEWEYLIVAIDTKTFQCKTDYYAWSENWVHMDRLGAQGWELIYITQDHNPHYTGVFKRKG